jgi:hypothetical protein
MGCLTSQYATCSILVLFCFSDKVSCVAQAGLKLEILLPQLPECTTMPGLCYACLLALHKSGPCALLSPLLPPLPSSFSFLTIQWDHLCSQDVSRTDCCCPRACGSGHHSCGQSSGSLRTVAQGRRVVLGCSEAGFSEQEQHGWARL